MGSSSTDGTTGSVVASLPGITLSWQYKPAGRNVLLSVVSRYPMGMCARIGNGAGIRETAVERLDGSSPSISTKSRLTFLPTYQCCLSRKGVRIETLLVGVKRKSSPVKAGAFYRSDALPISVVWVSA